jgi:hypothetical protein
MISAAAEDVGPQLNFSALGTREERSESNSCYTLPRFDRRLYTPAILM